MQELSLLNLQQHINLLHRPISAPQPHPNKYLFRAKREISFSQESLFSTQISVSHYESLPWFPSQSQCISLHPHLLKIMNALWAISFLIRISKISPPKDGRMVGSL